MNQVDGIAHSILVLRDLYGLQMKIGHSFLCRRGHREGRKLVNLLLMPKQRECSSSSGDLEGMEKGREGGGGEGGGRKEVLITFLTNTPNLIICSNNLNIITQGEGETYIFLLTLISF